MINHHKVIGELLARHGIDPERDWGSNGTKTLDELCAEVRRGESEVTEEEGRIIRTILPVMLRIRFGALFPILALVERERVHMETGRDMRRRLKASLAEKRMKGEDPYYAGLRGIHEELGINPIITGIRPDNRRLMLHQCPKTQTKPQLAESKSYLGVITRRIEVFYELALPKCHYRPEYVEERDGKRTVFGWVPWDDRPWK